MSSSDKIICFGSNFYGQLGLDANNIELGGPFDRHDFGKDENGNELNCSDIKDIQCGSQFTVVLKRDGQVRKILVIVSYCIVALIDLTYVA